MTPNTVLTRAFLAAIAAGIGSSPACSPPGFNYPPGPPKIARFSVVPDVVTTGGRVTVSWTILGAVEQASLSGLAGGVRAVRAEETLEIFPDATIDLDLQATGPGGATRSALRVTVVDPLEVMVERFDVAPEQIAPGEPVRITWQTRNALKVGLRLDSGEVLEAAALDRGSRTLRPQSDVAIELRADGYPQPIVRIARVRVSAGLPVIRSLRLTPRTVTPLEHSQLSWTVDRAKQIKVSEILELGEQPLFESPVPPVSGTISIDPAGGTKTLVLEASSAAGTARETAVLYVVPRTGPEIVDFTVTPTITGPNGEVLARWSTRFADTVALTIDGRAMFAGEVSGTSVLNLQASAAVGLLASVRGGTSASVTRNVAVDPSRPDLTVPGNLILGPPGPFQIPWAASRHDRVEVITETGARVYSSTADRGNVQLSLDRSVMLRFSAINRAGSNDRFRSVVVVPQPRILRFVKSASVARLGRKVELSWRARDAIRGDLRSHAASIPILSPGAIAIGSDIADGHARVDFNRAGTATVTLTGASSGLFESKNLTVRLLPSWAGPAESEPNDDEWTANGQYGGAPFAVSGTLPIGDVDMFAVSIPRATRISATTAPGPGCAAPIYADIYEERAGFRLGHPAITIRDPSGCAAIDALLQPAVAGLDSPVVIALYRPGGAAGSITSYRLQVTFDLARCGDGIRDRGEECDDGNLIPGDGCDARCRVEDLDEIEPNQTFLQATPIPIDRPIKAFLNDDDLDFFSFQIGPNDAGPMRILLEAPSAGGCGLDARLSLYRSDRLLAATDDGHLGCPMMTGPSLVLDPGSYYLSVTPGPGNVLSHRGRYQISILTR